MSDPLTFLEHVREAYRVKYAEADQLRAEIERLTAITTKLHDRDGLAKVILSVAQSYTGAGDGPVCMDPNAPRQVIVDRLIDAIIHYATDTRPT